MKKMLFVWLLAMSFPFVPTMSAEEVVFNKSKQMFQQGNKSKERGVGVVFLDDRILVRHRKNSQTYAEIPISSITGLKYELSKHPRIAASILVSPLFLFSSSKKHWLTIEYQTEGKAEFVIL
ncbi:MAG: hypothetical protein HY313_01135, partial [Acidobacteria bacterium]|nr:hypothetical protein [Acidobacteriota bacterium]